MQCDRCGEPIKGGAMVSLGARRPFRHLCRQCWTVETRTSNSRLISALNEMTRRAEAGDARRTLPDRREEPRMERNERRLAAVKSDRREAVHERRGDEERPRWHS